LHHPPAPDAAMADHHLKVDKVSRKEGVCVKVNELSWEERVEEIARMLSGKVTEISLTHARELLGVSITGKAPMKGRIIIDRERCKGCKYASSHALKGNCH